MKKEKNEKNINDKEEKNYYENKIKELEEKIKSNEKIKKKMKLLMKI